MRKTVLLFALMLGSLAFAQDYNVVPNELVGIWRNLDDEFIRILTNGQFERWSSEGDLLARGVISIEEGQLLIHREDVNDEYLLFYILMDDVFVVCKPRSLQAWVFEKIEVEHVVKRDL